MSTAFYSGNNNALIYDSLSERGQEEKFGEQYGIVSKMSQLALGVSAVFGAILLVKGSFSLLVWLSVIPLIICFIISFFIIEPTYHSRKSGNIYIHLKEAFLEFLHNPKLRLLSLSSILGYGFGETSFHFQSAVYSTVWPTWAIPIAKILSYFGAATSFHFSAKVINRFGEYKMLLAGNSWGRFITTIANIYPTVLTPILMSTTSFLYGTTSVSKSSLMQKEFKKEQRATMGSLDSFAGSLVFALASFSIGALADQLSPSKAVLILQGFMLITLYIYYKLFKSHRNSSQPLP